MAEPEGQAVEQSELVDHAPDATDADEKRDVVAQANRGEHLEGIHGVDAELRHQDSALAAWEAALAEREAALLVREKALAERMGAAHEILVAADERDAVSDSRDTGGDTREQVLDRAHFLATGETYGDERPMRRGAALDREHAKGDRAASRDDRVALTESPEELEADETEDDQP